MHILQTGMVAWGINCGTTTPGVYASVTAGLCFMDFVTKCRLGRDWDELEITGCQRWYKNQVDGLKEKRKDLR